MGQTIFSSCLILKAHNEPSIWQNRPSATRLIFQGIMYKQEHASILFHSLWVTVSKRMCLRWKCSQSLRVPSFLFVDRSSIFGNSMSHTSALASGCGGKSCVYSTCPNPDDCSGLQWCSSQFSCISIHSCCSDLCSELCRTLTSSAAMMDTSYLPKQSVELTGCSSKVGKVLSSKMYRCFIL